MTIELSGFATVAQGFEALVGQALTVNAQMMPSTVQESVTVTGEAPLIQTTSSTLAGNIDPRQTEDLPAIGGNWLELALLAPGNRSNGADPNTPTARNRFDMQLNIDGQQVTNNGRAGAANPRVTQDAIGEFQFVASRWDASQGRSNGVLVNAVTKSGTNMAAGTFSGIFRNDKFNAPDFIQNRVLPYSNSRFNGTFGGPIAQDRSHYFAFYERESEPSTITFNSSYPSFNVDQERDVKEWNGGTRLDFQAGGQNHLMVRGTKWRRDRPGVLGSERHRQPPVGPGLFGGQLRHRLRHVFDGAEQPRSERDKGRVHGRGGAKQQRGHVVRTSPGGARGGHQRCAAHQLQRLQLRQQQHELAADARAAGDVDSRRFHVFVQQRRPSRHEGGRGVSEHLLLPLQLPAVRRYL